MTKAEKLQIFERLDDALLHDLKPSGYLIKAGERGDFEEKPFDLLGRLSETKQSPQHHPEGDVWKHTLLVVDEAAQIKSRSKNPRVLMWAALLHDIGKPDTTKIRKGRITSYSHDIRGAALVLEFLGCFSDDADFIRKVAALVRWHMQILFVVRDMPFADIGGMAEETDIEEVALLGFCDRMGRLNVNRRDEEENIRQFKEKCGRNTRGYMKAQPD